MTTDAVGGAHVVQVRHRVGRDDVRELSGFRDTRAFRMCHHARGSCSMVTCTPDGPDLEWGIDGVAHRPRGTAAEIQEISCDTGGAGERCIYSRDERCIFSERDERLSARRPMHLLQLAIRTRAETCSF